MQSVESLSQGIVIHRHRDIMDVIAHETIGPYVQRVFVAVIQQQLKILDIVFVRFKDGLAIIAPLGDVMGISDRYGA
jgi:hypothetical protein